MSELPPVIILAGGRGTRLGALTAHTPKSMVEVNGKPFIAHQLSLLAKQGLNSVVLCVGYLWQPIKNFVGDGNTFGLTVSYSYDDHTPLGTGGAIKTASTLMDCDVFGVMYGDSYLDVEFAPIFARFNSAGKQGLMTVFANDNRFAPSNVWLQDGAIKAYFKGQTSNLAHHIDFGFLIFRKSAFDQYLPAQSFDLSVVLLDLVACAQLGAYEIFQRFYEIGSMEGLRQTEKYLASQSHPGINAGVYRGIQRGRQPPPNRSEKPRP